MKGRARVAEAQMHELKAETSAVENERAMNEARMREPQNRAVLDRSKFLNALFEAKSFSWTAVMIDLETVLPAGVQVTSIEPVISAEGDVNVHLRVSGPRDLQVDLVRNLERSQRFLAPHVANETAQQEEQGRPVYVSGAGVQSGVQFDIVSGYKPLPAGGLNKPERKELAEKDEKNAARPDVGQRPAPVHKAGPMNKAATKKAGVHGGAR
jgi:type IV pilus assembly protein PilN